MASTVPVRITCGIDVVDMERFSSVLKRSGEAFIRRIYTDNEIAYAGKYSRSREQHLAGRFAVKEAVIKAVSQIIGDPSLGMRSIEVSVDELGRPSVQIHNARAKGINVQISMSHVQTVAVANAIAWREE